MIQHLLARQPAARPCSRLAIGWSSNGLPRTYRLTRPRPRRFRLWAALSRRSLP